MPFGQLVIGPPGSGKSTYCHGMSQFLINIGRDICIINLDPANDYLPYQCDINICELISLNDTMEEYNLGPNGGLIFCMEYLIKNIDWLKEKLDLYKNKYIIIDCPGQAELYTHLTSIRDIVENLINWDYRLTAIHLVDAHHICDSSKYISILLLSLSTMLHINISHINVLSKMDLLKKSQLEFDLDYYLEVGNLEHILEKLDNDSFTSKFKELNAALCGLIEDFSLVSFIPLSINSKKGMLTLSKAIDKANGFEFKANPYYAFKDDGPTGEFEDYEKEEDEEEFN